MKEIYVILFMFLIGITMGQSDPEIEDSLISYLKDNDIGVRIDAASALGNIGSSKAILPLIEALTDENNSVQEAALSSLFSLGEPAKSELIKQLGNNSTDSKRKRAVINALNKWSTNIKTFTSITEIAGLRIADRMAKNWSDSARLIDIGISESTEYCSNDECDLYFTGWGYIYESNDKYIMVKVNLSDYDIDTGRISEINQTSAWNFRFKQPLKRDWTLTAIDALNALSNNVNYSEKRGDIIITLFLDMGEFDNQIVPLWHVSIQIKGTNEVRSYLINAKNGEIIVS